MTIQEQINNITLLVDLSDPDKDELEEAKYRLTNLIRIVQPDSNFKKQIDELLVDINNLKPIEA